MAIEVSQLITEFDKVIKCRLLKHFSVDDGIGLEATTVCIVY